MSNSTAGSATATTLIKDDVILVTLAAVKNAEGKASRFSVSAAFNGEGKRVDGEGNVVEGSRGLDPDILYGSNSSTAPEFSMESYTAAILAGDQDEAQSILDSYNYALAAWKQAGNMTVADRIGHAVLDWAKKEHNVHTEDGDHPVVNPENIIVKPGIRLADDPTTWTVQMAPVWG